MKYIYFIALISFLPACTSKDTEEQRPYQLPTAQEIKKNQDELVYDLDQSTDIIITLLKSGELTSILSQEAKDTPDSIDTIDTLVKNFSPAQMAFEAEVLNFAGPVVVLYYNGIDDDSSLFNSFLATALAHRDKAKFVKVETSKLFSLADYALVSKTPTVVVIHNRNEIGRIETPNDSLLEIEIIKLLEKAIKE